MAQALLEYETLTGDELKELIETGKLDRPEAPSGIPLPAAIRGTSVPRAAVLAVWAGLRPKGRNRPLRLWIEASLATAGPFPMALLFCEGA
jgi:hypothetical protein